MSPFSKTRPYKANYKKPPGIELLQGVFQAWVLSCRIPAKQHLFHTTSFRIDHCTTGRTLGFFVRFIREYIPLFPAFRTFHFYFIQRFIGFKSRTMLIGHICLLLGKINRLAAP